MHKVRPLERISLLWLAVIVLMCAGLAPANSRAQGLGLLPPVISATDENGVDLVSGSYKAPMPTLSAGTKDSGISRTQLGSTPYMDSLSSVITGGRMPCNPCSGYPYDGTVNISASGSSDVFLIPLGDGTGQLQYADYMGTTSNPYSNPQYPGADSLSCTGAVCTYTLGDGTVATFNKTASGNQMEVLPGDIGRITQIVKPDGEVLTYSYKEYITAACTPSCSTIDILGMRQVTSSLGWTVRYQLGNTSGAVVPNQVSIVNGSVDYCDPNADTCTAADQSTWPTLIGQGFYPNSSGGALEGFSITASSYTPIPTMYVSGYTSPLGGSVSTTLFPGHQYDSQWNNDYKVQTLTRNGKTWTYQYALVNGVATTTVTNPEGKTRVLTFDSFDSNAHMGLGRANQILSVQDELGRVTHYQYYPDSMLVSQVIEPEATYSGSTLTGGYTQYSYDPRHNVTQIAKYPKGGGTPIITSAVYPTTCTNQVTCNKPTSVTDANNNTTTYTYDPTHGGVLTETKAAVNGVQAQTRYSYSQITPWVLNSSGVLTAQPPVWRQTGKSVCRTMTLATCVGTADEIKTIVSYGSDNTHPTYHNVLPVSITTVAGDGSNSSTITYTYDTFGRVTSVKGPRTDVDDTRYTTYDTYGRPLLQIGADPDGSGPLPRQATKTTYDAEGRVLEVDTGTTNTTNGSDFTVTSSKINTYDTTSGMLVQSQDVQP